MQKTDNRLTRKARHLLNWKQQLHDWPLLTKTISDGKEPRQIIRLRRTAVPLQTFPEATDLTGSTGPDWLVEPPRRTTTTAIA